MRLGSWGSRIVLFLFFLVLFSSLSRADVSPLLEDLLKFHPSWVTKSVTSHDPYGHNGDGSGAPYGAEWVGFTRYHKVFQAFGEGRVTRLWFTFREEDMDRMGEELWIQVDGKTWYQGPAIDLFQGRSGWRSPLVMGFQESSGAFLSYAPIPFSHEIKILWKANPRYFQVTYRQGAGASQGPSAEEITSFMSEHWWESEEGFSPPRAISVAGRALETLAEGPALVSGIDFHSVSGDLNQLRVRVGHGEPVPFPFFFGSGGGVSPLRSAIHFMDPERAIYRTRLPIPLREGESLDLLSGDGSEVVGQVRLQFAEWPSSRIHELPRMIVKFQEEWSDARPRTMEVLNENVPLQYVSLIEEIREGRPGDRYYLEGDEMIRTDGMSYPLQIGTGTEDYYNGGWYFLGAHSNPFSGQPRFIVENPGTDWSEAHFKHGMYRHHLVDPIVSRNGFRFGFEAGDVGNYDRAHFSFLSFAYAFEHVAKLGHTDIPLSAIETVGGHSNNYDIESAFDAEWQTPETEIGFREHRGVSKFQIPCPGGVDRPDGVFLTRTFDADNERQRALVKVSAREGGILSSSFSNSGRRFAQDGVWLDLERFDCDSGHLDIEVWATDSPDPWTESSYHAEFFRVGTELPEVVIGDKFKIQDTSEVRGSPFYMNDHTFVRGFDWKWHLFGIFNGEPYRPEMELQFSHSRSLTENPRNWGDGEFHLDAEPALQADLTQGETVVWAPHVIREGDLFFMFYHSGGMQDSARISLATSSDLTHWDHHGLLFSDICVSRDPMVKKIGDLFVMYYTRCDGTDQRKSGVAYRTSKDLRTWSEPQMAFIWWSKPSMFNSGYTESPFVFERNGWFYLSFTGYPDAYNASYLIRSRSPFLFSGDPFMRFDAHAPEWVPEWEDSWGRFRGPLVVSHAGAGQGGVWGSHVDFRGGK